MREHDGKAAAAYASQPFRAWPNDDLHIDYPPAVVSLCTLPVMLARHDFAADFILPTPDGVATRFYGLAGGQSTLLVFVPVASSEELLSEIAALALDTDSALFVVHARAPISAVSGAKVLVDAEGEIARRYGVSDGLCVFVLSENLRVLEACDSDHLTRAKSALAETAAAPHPSSNHAPVLVIPHALDDAFCDRLIAFADSQAAEETGVERSRDGRRRLDRAPDMKRRRDITLANGALMKELTAAVGRRVMPEVLKAFSFRATRFEGFKICRYNADEGGFFTRHRDNLSPRTSHRRFALTLHLNDDHDGGELQFPEYGARHRSEKGRAVVFSGSLMHEVLPVTRGQRHVLLSFLFREQDRRPGRP